MTKLRLESIARREYSVTVMSGGRGTAFWAVPPTTWRSTTRIRQFVVTIFRKYAGGRNPQFAWAKDGFMGEARGHGLHVTVYQENWWNLFGPGQTFAHRPLCPMVRKEAA